MKMTKVNKLVSAQFFPFSQIIIQERNIDYILYHLGLTIFRTPTLQSLEHADVSWVIHTNTIFTRLLFNPSCSAHKQPSSKATMSTEPRLKVAIWYVHSLLVLVIICTTSFCSMVDQAAAGWVGSLSLSP